MLKEVGRNTGRNRSGIGRGLTFADPPTVRKGWNHEKDVDRSFRCPRVGARVDAKSGARREGRRTQRTRWLLWGAEGLSMSSAQGPM